MKRTLITLLLCAAALLALAGCTDEPDHPAETGDTAVAETPAATEPETPSESLLPDPAPESETTPAETTAAESVPETDPVPSLMTVVDLDLLKTDIDGYLSRSTNCAATIADDSTEGRVLRLSAKGVSGIADSHPTTILALERLISDMNGILPANADYPYLALKVKVGEAWSRTFGLYPGESAREAAPAEGESLCARIQDADGWQYILFDLSERGKDAKYLYLNFIAYAKENGESVDVAEFRFFATREEAVATCGETNKYPVVSQSADDYTLKVISYNVWVGNGTDFNLRGDILREFMDTYQPDSIGLQEVNPNWRRQFERIVFNDSYVGVGEPRNQSDFESCMIFYRADKFDLLDSGTFWLSDTPDVPASAYAESKYPRICTWVKLKDRETGLVYAHVNVHLDHLGGADGRALRLKQMKVVLEFVQTLGNIPVVMTGDFNQNPANSKGEFYPVYKYITGQDSYTTDAGVEIRGPFADSRFEAKETVPADRIATMTKYYDETNDAYDPAHQPIDFMFYTPTYFEPLLYNSLLHHRDGQFVSDHLPIITEVKFIPQA